MDCCPHCQRPWVQPPTNSPSVSEAVEAMRAACGASGIPVTWDLHVSESDAATLTRRAVSTLRNRRSIDRPIPFRKVGRRIEYALADLCQWQDSNVENISF